MTKKLKVSYKRNLPHLQPPNAVFAITICLSGALPKKRIEELIDERSLRIFEIKASELTEKEQEIALTKAHQIYFGKFDDLLDNANTGPTWLSRKDVAQVVVNSLEYLDGKDFKLACYSIMSNHIHLVVYKCKRQLFDILGRFKSFTGLKANDLIYGKSRQGNSRPQFWQNESYDRFIRNRREFYAQTRYAVNNPVKAGLVTNWRSWRFTYLREEFEYIVL